MPEPRMRRKVEILSKVVPGNMTIKLLALNNVQSWGTSKADIWRMSIPGRKKSKYKGVEARTRLVHLRTHKDATAVTHRSEKRRERESHDVVGPCQPH